MNNDELRLLMRDFIQVMKVLNRREVDIHQYPKVILLLLPLLKIKDGYELDFYNVGGQTGSRFVPYVCRADATEPYIPTVYEDGTPVEFIERYSLHLDLFGDMEEEPKKIHIPYDETKRVVDMLAYDECKDIPKALSYFRVQFTKAGILQAWLLENISNLLPLNWHSGYNRVSYILDEEEIDWGFVSDFNSKEFEYAEEAIWRMDRESLYPTVNVNGDEALLTVTYWNAWSGLVKMNVKANKKGSGIVFEEAERTTLVSYKTGIRF